MAPACVLVLFLALPAFSTASAAGPNLSRSDTIRIGKRIWQNECNGTVAGLTSWNAGENFASLGIGHFIWYPKDARGPFEESFPEFMSFIKNRQVDVPSWLQQTTACPWDSRAEFLREENSAQMRQLREFLAHTVDLQAQFLVERLHKSLPKMLAETDPAQRSHVEQAFDRVAATPAGCYALVDYVNFKGEGVLATERYAGQGWGLLQVLEGMSSETSGRSAAQSFADSAKKVLTRRVQNSPPGRGEARWLPGWLSRVSSYTKS
jgi:hypothetical protein